jgi:hypothetical protein
VGSAFLLAAVLTKPTAALHALPLVLGWWFVERPSLLRLGVVVGGAGAAALAALQWATGGGFVHVNRLWGLHPHFASQTPLILGGFILETAPHLALLGAGIVVAWLLGAKPHRSSAILLVAGGALAIPMLSKSGASWNYLLPLHVGVAVLLGQVAGTIARLRPAWSAGIGALLGAVALAVGLARPFPLPDERAASTAEAFYGLVRESVTESGAPLLALRPDYAYVVVGQPLEVDGGGSFYHLAKQGVPGTERVLAGVRTGAYGVVVGGPWFFPETGGWMEALNARYRPLAVCGLRYYFGRVPFALYVRREATQRAYFPPGADCGSFDASGEPRHP